MDTFIEMLKNSRQKVGNIKLYTMKILPKYLTSLATSFQSTVSSYTIKNQYINRMSTMNLLQLLKMFQSYSGYLRLLRNRKTDCHIFHRTFYADAIE